MGFGLGGFLGLIISCMLLIFDLLIMQTQEIDKMNYFKEHFNDSMKNDNFFYYFYCITFATLFAYLYDALNEYINKRSSLYNKAIKLFKGDCIIKIY